MNQRKMKLVAISSLAPYDKNPVKHSKRQIDLLMRSIEEFGWTNPVLVDDKNNVIGGHARLKAAEALGRTKVPVVVLSDLTKHQIRAYRIADNKLAQLAQWDDDLLPDEIAALHDAGYDLELTGFNIDELNALLDHEPPDEDDAPDPPKRPKTKPGDLYRLGDHRLLCGDSESPEAVERLLAGAVPHLMVTDPPYGVSYDAEWREKSGLQKAGAYGKVSNDHQSDWRSAWQNFPGDVAYVWHGGLASGSVADSLAASGFDIRAQIIWAKSRIVIGRGHYHYQHEPCFYAVRKGGKAHWQGSRKQATVWSIDKPQKSETGHSTQKPIECMRRPILNNSKVGDAIYEPFAGSGTTLIAAELTDRIAYCMELDPAYCDVIVKRWELQSGQKAEKETRNNGRKKKASRKKKAG